MKIERNNIYSILFFAAIALLISCSEDDTEDMGEIPVADFNASSTDVEAGTKVIFNDLSTNNPKLWTWQFEGASPTYSNEKNPEVEYIVKGQHSVTLTVRNSAGADEITKTGYVSVTAPPIPYLANYGFNGNLNDEGSNEIIAVSNFGDPTYVSDRSGNPESAWETPGNADEFLTIPGYKGITGDAKRTVMAWVKILSTSTGRNTIVSWGTNSSTEMFNVMVHQGMIRVEAGACNVRSTYNTLLDNAWHHIAVTYDPADGPEVQDVKMYVDGQPTEVNLDKSYNAGTNIQTASDADVRMGFAIYSSSHIFKGAVDDIQILDIVLSPEEIAALASQ